MSDEEGGWMNDDTEENEDQEEERRETKTTASKPRAPRKEEPVTEKNEVQQILEAKMKKQEEEDTDRIREIEEARRVEREKEDEELRKLKEKQAQRKKERELEDQKIEEQRRQLEEKRKQEEEQRKQRLEEERRKKQELLEQKKAAAQAAIVGGRNFVIEKDKEAGSTIDKFMNISKAKTEMSLNTGELQALKMRTINERVKPLALSELDHAALKAKAEELWKTIVVLETSKYDLAERATRQEYDLKELNERQRQMNVKKHVAQGLDADAAHSRYPPKVQLISKYERRTDRRTFEERKAIFEMERKRLEELELAKPTLVKRESWVKGKKTGEDEENGDDNLGPTEEEPDRVHDEEKTEEDGNEQVQEEEESIW